MPRRLFHRLAVPVCALLAGLAASTGAAPEAPYPRAPDDTFLSLRNGRLYKDGRPYRAVGYNHYTAFGPENICPREHLRRSFEDAKQEGVRLFRFVINPTNPIELIPWIKNPGAYWKTHRETMDLAFASGADLVARLQPEVFWQLAAFLSAAKPPYTEYVPYDVYPKDMADRDSAGFKLLERYLGELIGHYRDEPRLLAWELGNEWDHLGNVQHKDVEGKYRIYFGPAMFRLREGTRVMTTSEDYVALSRNLIDVIKTHDPRRLVFPGYGGPREWEYNKWKNNTWQPDTQDQMKEFTVFMHRIPGLDAFGLHFYNGARNRRFCGPGEYNTGMLPVFSGIAGELGLPVYIGEFGDPGSIITAQDGCPWTNAVIEHMKTDDRIQIACVWAWYPALNPSQDDWRMEKFPQVRAAVRAANQFFTEHQTP